MTKKPFRSWVIALITLFFYRRITNNDTFKGSWVMFTTLVSMDMYKGHTPKDLWGKVVVTVKFWKKSRKCFNRARIVKNMRS